MQYATRGNNYQSNNFTVLLIYVAVALIRLFTLVWSTAIVCFALVTY